MKCLIYNANAPLDEILSIPDDSGKGLYTLFHNYINLPTYGRSQWERLSTKPRIMLLSLGCTHRRWERGGFR